MSATSRNALWTQRQVELLSALGVPSWVLPTAVQPMPAASPTQPQQAPASPSAPARAKPPPVSDSSTAPAGTGTAAAVRADSTLPTHGPSRPKFESLEAVHAAITQCQRCPLAGTRRHTVPGGGFVRPHWLIVGEAPGEQEDLSGQAFVGAAGHLLDAMLASLSLTRDTTVNPPPDRQVFITNTVKCRPPGNRNPLPEESQACAPYLDAQISLLKPRVILALGRVAAHRLLHSSESLGQLRGRVHAGPEGLPVVVSYHPAYLLRQPRDKRKAWQDWCLAQSVVLDAQARHLV